MRVAVVGAGIIGATSAVAVKSAFPRLDVHVFAEEFCPNTTGDGSAGLWSPYLLGETPRDKVLKWGGIMFRWLDECWRSGLASEMGISLLPVYRVTSDPRGYSDCSWTKLAYGAHRLTPEQLKRLNEEHGSSYKDGWMFLSYTAEPIRLLPWLTAKFVAAGGEVRKRKIRTFQELADDGYDLIVNCSGLGARVLAADNTVQPIRGQVARVTASGTMHACLVDDDDSHYIIPNFDTTVLGGTHQENDYDCTPRAEDAAFIYDGCSRMLPALKKGTEPVKEWVGLRPGRPSVRLEAEVIESPRGKFTVVHNYGHGGSGVTLSWGCAVDVVAIIRDVLRSKSHL